jgi:RNA polymerase sigma-70 factor, ECF subfamily
MSISRPKPPTTASPQVAVAFRKYAPALHRYLLRRLRRSVDVQDLTQEVFERYLRVADVDTVRNPLAYLYGIATHVVADARLREEQNRITYDSEAAEAAAGSQAVNDDLADRLGFAQELEQALAHLPDMHKAVLLLAVRDGCSHREVAQLTGLTEKTVGFYVCEAKARLRAILRPRPEE